jgi:hypothetical protein
MKRIILIVVGLLQAAVIADATMIAPSQQWANILSDGNADNNSTGNDSAHTVYVSNPIMVTTQHKCHRHHTAAPRYDLKKMNTAQLVCYFNAHGYTEEQILERQDLFSSAAFVALAQQLPKYPEYIKKYYHEYRNFNWYTKLVGCAFSFYTPGFQDTFTQLYREYKEQQRTLQARERKKEQANAAYCAQLDALAHDEFMISQCRSSIKLFVTMLACRLKLPQ